MQQIHAKVVRYAKYLSTPVRMVGMGEADVAIAVQSETLRYINDNYPISIIYPKDGTAYQLSLIHISTIYKGHDALNVEGKEALVLSSAIHQDVYKRQGKKMRMIGVTGTNGKTSSTYMLRDILRKAGYKVGVIGTIKIMIEDEEMPIHNTTPDVIDLQEILDNCLLYTSCQSMYII